MPYSSGENPAARPKFVLMLFIFCSAITDEVFQKQPLHFEDLSA
jgi:hypothetical protein